MICSLFLFKKSVLTHFLCLDLYDPLLKTQKNCKFFL